MLNKALRIGQNIANAHPSDVRLLFQAYGIKAEPTGKTILDAYLVYGKPFLMKLIDIGYKSVNPLSSITGTTALEVGKLTAYEQAAKDKAASEAAKTKAETTDGIMNWFNVAATGLQVVSGYYTTISNMLQGKAVNTGVNDPNAAIAADYIAAQKAAQEAAAANQTKTYLLIGFGLLVAVLVAMMFLKRK